jgi:hypothetical protein
MNSAGKRLWGWGVMRMSQHLSIAFNESWKGHILYFGFSWLKSTIKLGFLGGGGGSIFLSSAGVYLYNLLKLSS